MCECSVASAMSISLHPYGLWPAGLFCPWDSPRQEYWSGLPCLPPEDLPDPGIKPTSPTSSASQADSLLLSHLGKLQSPTFTGYRAQQLFLIISTCYSNSVSWYTLSNNISHLLTKYILVDIELFALQNYLLIKIHIGFDVSDMVVERYNHFGETIDTIKSPWHLQIF